MSAPHFYVRWRDFLYYGFQSWAEYREFVKRHPR